MTDADVDGSHIRTLLLTFFYRQMTEILERGHIFIAQPPLYKTKKGKQEQYLKDDDALESYLLNIALENSSIYVNEDAPPIQGASLENLVTQFTSTSKLIKRMSRFYPLHLLENLIYSDPLSINTLENAELATTFASNYAKLLNDAESDGARYEVESVHDEETNLSKLITRVYQHGVMDEYVFNADFVKSAELQKISDLNKAINNIIEEGGYVKRGEKTKEITRFAEAFEWLMAESKKGQYIQRYKGLGEMNPDQLWETTMDPETRRMLRVSIEDAIAADQLFTTLMGDNVEPRKLFIQENALKVTNLDV
jgi:DNA gyrase subunit B